MRKIVNGIFFILLITILTLITVYTATRIHYTREAKTYDISLILSDTKTDQPSEETLSLQLDKATEIDPWIYQNYDESWKLKRLARFLIVKRYGRSIPMELAAKLHDYPESSREAFFLEMAIADRILEEFTREEIIYYYFSKAESSIE